MALDRGSFWHLEWGVISAVPGTMDQIQLAQGPETLTGVAVVRNPGCKEEKLTNCSVMKGKSVYWFMTLKIHSCLASRIAAHNSSFSSWTLPSSVLTTFSGRFCVIQRGHQKMQANILTEYTTPEEQELFY